MADSREIDDQVDFRDENYEEMDDDDVDGEEHLEEGDGADDKGEEQEDVSGYDGKEEVSEGDGNQNANEEESTVSGGGDKGEHAELLALPPRGSEIFVGGLSKEVVEEDLSELCEPFGDVVEVKLVRNGDTNKSKGFAFVSFRTKDAAQKAIEELHSKEFKGKILRCSLSETKYRLFIGNVPKNWTDDDFRKVIEDTGPGSEVIELIKDPQNSTLNRGFAFVEYYNNACADYSRQKLSSASFKLDGNTPTVTWADHKISADPSAAAAAAQVKTLYVKNIPEKTPTGQLKEMFQRHGEVTRVVMPHVKAGCKRDFGFVHFAERSSALKAVEDTEKYEVDGQVLEVVLAKPHNEKKSDGIKKPHHSGSRPNYPNYIPHPVSGGFSATPYGTPRYALNSLFQQPMIYGRGPVPGGMDGRGPVPGGMQMVPMVLPDGQIGYVLQQPGAQMPARLPRRNGRGSSKGSGGGRRQGGGGSGDDNASRGRYRPY